ncbi:hypothetical protein SAMN06264346_101159 [Chryseobacterium profundimaris]|uniref:Uncharacterized protein n=1 Tax=Chryseobacterium profundimaris TaxID=1387275 RepID=A0ABY1N9D9_9FLAO|nr:hypothetical protein SAMN06264346_101159 [Chryseobacterium profundimaris]
MMLYFEKFISRLHLTFKNLNTSLDVACKSLSRSQIIYKERTQTIAISPLKKLNKEKPPTEVSGFSIYCFALILLSQNSCGKTMTIN